MASHNLPLPTPGTAPVLRTISCTDPVERPATGPFGVGKSEVQIIEKFRSFQTEIMKIVSVHKVSFNQRKIEAVWRWVERLPIRSARAPGPHGAVTVIPARPRDQPISPGVFCGLESYETSALLVLDQHQHPFAISSLDRFLDIFDRLDGLS